MAHSYGARLCQLALALALLLTLCRVRELLRCPHPQVALRRVVGQQGSRRVLHQHEQLAHRRRVGQEDAVRRLNRGREEVEMLAVVLGDNDHVRVKVENACVYTG